MRNQLSVTSIIVVMAILLTGCVDRSLKRQVETLDKQCPIDLGILGRVTSVGLKGHTIVYHVTTNSRVLKLERLRDHLSDVKQGILLNFANDEASLSQFVAAQCDIKYEYTDAQSGERLVVDISKEDLKRANALVGDTKELSSRRIENFVATGRLQLPMQIDAVTTLTDITLEDNNVAYIYSIDEEAISSKQLQSQIDVLKESIHESLGHKDLTMTMLIDALTQDHRGLVYRYFMSKSGKQFDITFTPEDVAQIKQQQ